MYSRSYKKLGVRPWRALKADTGERVEWKSWLKTHIQKTKILTSGPITLWQVAGEKVDAVTDFIFLGFKITADGDCSHEIKILALCKKKWKWLVSDSLQSMDCSPPGSSVHGILQARVLDWVAISFSRGIVPIEGLNLGLLQCRQILYHLSHQQSPKLWQT